MSNLIFHAESVATTAKQVLAENQARRKLTFKNHGSVTVFLHQNNGVTSSNGYPLVQNAVLEITAQDGPTWWAWWAIASSASADLRIIEEVSS